MILLLRKGPHTAAVALLGEWLWGQNHEGCRRHVLPHLLHNHKTLQGMGHAAIPSLPPTLAESLTAAVCSTRDYSEELMRTHSQFLGCGLTTSITQPVPCLGPGTTPHSLQMFTTNVQYLSFACNLHRFYTTEDFALLLPCPCPRSGMHDWLCSVHLCLCSLSALLTPSPRFLAAPAVL